MFIFIITLNKERKMTVCAQAMLFVHTPLAKILLVRGEKKSYIGGVGGIPAHEFPGATPGEGLVFSASPTSPKT
ncbi:MAG: hypothetical protein C0514_07595 [Candidatus Puniceispirillum sp.]|nr:hypothetical protein [Candidatus Puniceispirillum sp.]